MAEEEKNKHNDIPSVFLSAPDSSTRQSSYKKYVIIAVGVVLGVAIILTAILVGMYLFSETQKEIIKFSYNREDNSKEDVESDPSANTVQYHVSNEAYEAWIFNDFNKDIQVLKVKTGDRINCYANPLNRTIATDPTQISAPTENAPTKPKHKLRYLASADAISDLSFMYKTARDACKGISTYWLFPSCVDQTDYGKRMERRDRVKKHIRLFWGLFDYEIERENNNK